MPKPAKYTLIWSIEQDIYTLYAQESRDTPVLQGDDEAWFAWLSTHTSFSFQGRHGHLNLLKEVRLRSGEGYWYAYRRQGKRTVKQYAGRTTDLTMGRLEGIAQALGTFIDGTSPATGEHRRGKRSVVPQLSTTAEASEVPETHVANGAVTSPASQPVIMRVEPQQGVPAPLSTASRVPLLASKLHLPRLRTSLVFRERLLARLDGGLERKLTLLSAPAGFGKTTLVSQWIADRSTSQNFPPLAWVSLDPGDNDPVRFWRYIITACQPFQTDHGQSALALLFTPSSFEPSPLETVLTTFLNALTQHGILVLEDYHVITESRIHEMVTFVLDHLPALLHLVIITRGDPPLPLARLRASDDLCELHAPDLRFSQEETSTFLSRTVAFPLSQEIISDLEARLQGWPAGLRLLAFTLQRCNSSQQVEQSLSTFAGSHQPVLEYFVTEVLSAQPEQLRAFLLSTSMLNRLSGFLCDAVTGRNDSERLLAALDHAGLFLEPLDESGQWYRYHALFAEAMQYEARRRLGQDVLRALSARAGRWYEQHDMLPEAIEAALDAHDVVYAAALIERFIERERFHEIHEYYTLRGFLEQMPEELLERHPILSLSHATSLLFVNSDRFPPATIARLERLLQMAERGFRERDDTEKLGEVFAIRALIAWRQEEIVQAETYANQALALLPGEKLAWQSLSLSILARKELLSGQLDAARKLLRDARALSEVTGDQYFKRATTNMLGGVCFGQGELHQAAAYYRQVLEQARAQEDLDDIGHALLGLAQLSYEWNALEAAGREAQEALELGQRLAHEAQQAHAEIILARVQHARKQTPSAQQRLALRLARMQPHSSALLHREMLSWQARLSLAMGDLAAVQRWMTDLARHGAVLPSTHQEREELLIARLLITRGEIQQVLDTLERLLIVAREAGRIHSALEIQVLMALAYTAHKQAHEARQRLWAVLPLAHTEGYMRLFLDEGETIAILLRTMVPHVREQPLMAYLQTILRAFASEQTGPVYPTSVAPASLIEPLSPQEQRVLRLLAAGRSNPEIASALVVSVNTIRTQVQSIYHKLGVNNRVAASEVARQLHLV